MGLGVREERRLLSVDGTEGEGQQSLVGLHRKVVRDQ
jgi:hypothetical protein